MTSAKIALLATAAIFALGLTTMPAGAARTTGHALNKPADIRGPSKAAQDAKKAPAAPTMGQALNTPVDVGEPRRIALFKFMIISPSKSGANLASIVAEKGLAHLPRHSL